MEPCKHYNKDWIDYDNEIFNCSHDPYVCMNFDPDKYHCHYMERAGYDEELIRKWKVWYFKKRMDMYYYKLQRIFLYLLIGALMILVLWIKDIYFI